MGSRRGANACCLPAAASRLLAAIVAASTLATSHATGLPPVSAAPPLDDTTVITLVRGNCSWRCPEYSVALYGSGRVEFQGRRLVCYRGRHSASIDPMAVRVLVASMIAAGYLYLAWREGPVATGSDVVTTSLLHHGRLRTIRHDHGDGAAPRFLRQIEDRIDAIAGTARWLPEREDHRPVCRLPDGSAETLEE